MKRYDEGSFKIAREWFSGKDDKSEPHRVEFRGSLPNNCGELIVWKRPGSGIFAIHYLLYHSVLFVTGDLGEAVYRWSQPISVPFLAGCNIDYFESKCVASESGREYRDWSEEECLTRIEEHLREAVIDALDLDQEVIEEEIREELYEAHAKEHPDDEDYEPGADRVRELAQQHYDDLIQKHLKGEGGNESVTALVEAAEWAKKAAIGKSDWQEFMGGEECRTLFGDAFYEYAPGMGETISLRCYAHLEGLRMIYELDQARERAEVPKENDGIPASEG